MSHTHAIINDEHKVLCSFNANASPSSSGMGYSGGTSGLREELCLEWSKNELVFSARRELARVQADRDWSIIPLCGWSVLPGDTVRTENGTICSVLPAGCCMLLHEESGEPCCKASESQVQAARCNGGVVTVNEKRYVLDEHYPEEYEPWPSST